jgi:hypothetical protein
LRGSKGLRDTARSTVSPGRRMHALVASKQHACPATHQPRLTDCLLGRAFLAIYGTPRCRIARSWVAFGVLVGSGCQKGVGMEPYMGRPHRRKLLGMGLKGAAGLFKPQDNIAGRRKGESAEARGRIPTQSQRYPHVRNLLALRAAEVVQGRGGQCQPLWVVQALCLGRLGLRLMASDWPLAAPVRKGGRRRGDRSRRGGRLDDLTLATLRTQERRC